MKKSCAFFHQDVSKKFESFLLKMLVNSLLVKSLDFFLLDVSK